MKKGIILVALVSIVVISFSFTRSTTTPTAEVVQEPTQVKPEINEAQF